MTILSVEPVLRSRNTSNSSTILSTFLFTYPRWIHAEQRTHRVLSIDEALDFLPPTPSLMADPNLSRNSASSRAIPVPKMVADIRANPAVPLFWGKNVAGMQHKEELKSEWMDHVRQIWLLHMEDTLRIAEHLSSFALDTDGNEVGVHKQIVNRLLEPFSHIRVLVSATEWENFIELRDHADAEPHIQVIARLLRKELEREDNIQDLEPGDWHTPFVSRDYALSHTWSMARKISAACCASTSYKTVEGFDMTQDRALAIYDKLVGGKPFHASPFEHVAQADDRGTVYWSHPEEHRNFVGFRQWRAQIEAE